LTAKVRVGLANSRLVDTTQLRKLVNTSESDAAAQKIADKSVTLVRDEKKIVPLDGNVSTFFYTLVEGAASTEGVAFETEVKKRLPSATFLRGSSGMTSSQLEGLMQTADRYVIVAFASVAPSRGSAALGGNLPGFVDNLIATKKPVVFVAMGNPYLLRNFPDVAAYLTTYSTVEPSERAAAKALFGEIAISGKLPVSIPGLAKIGDGLGLPAGR
jgi:beta-N-acetylhexosaminidase